MELQRRISIQPIRNGKALYALEWINEKSYFFRAAFNFVPENESPREYWINKNIPYEIISVPLTSGATKILKNQYEFLYTLPLNEDAEKSWQKTKEVLKSQGLENEKTNNETITSQHQGSFTTIFQPDEASSSYVFEGNVPITSVNEALILFEKFPGYHEISPDTVTEFWKHLLFHIKKRDDEEGRFFKAPENEDRTAKELIQEFDLQHPKVLIKLSQIWSKILNDAGLFFDPEPAKHPVQLTDNLEVFIKLSSTGQSIPYQSLSAGIRNYIFKIGHLFSIFFNRKIENSLLFIDEPENGLFPDILYNLIEIYQQAVYQNSAIQNEESAHNSQMFFATHSPIIAAQFEPYERFILDFNGEGLVESRRGTAPIGDDPNDVFWKDFGFDPFQHKAGKKAWNEFLQLKKDIPNTEDKQKKQEMI